MRLSRLQISGVRNLHDLDIRLSPAMNVVHGPNASGKSSLLEAIHILSSGKSFRTRHLAHVLRYDAAGLSISAEIEIRDHGAIPVGLAYERGGGRIRLRAREKNLQRISELASILPLVTLHQDSHRVFTESPQSRRRFVDWGLFHVEPGFLPVWRRYRRALKQRNLMLHRGEDQPEVWDHELSETAISIHGQRIRYLNDLLPVFQDLAGMLEIPESITMEYRAGWDSERDYRAMLRQSLRGDQAAGFTRFGPHRADVEFRIDGAPLSERLSRGQIKVLTYALNLALVVSYNKNTGRQSLLTLDDLTAELDDPHIHRLLTKIHELSLQVVVTTSEQRLFDHLREYDHKMFHVEHGNLVEVI